MKDAVLQDPRRDKGMHVRVVIEPVAMGMDAVDAARRAFGYAQGLTEVEVVPAWRFLVGLPDSAE